MKKKNVLFLANEKAL